MGPLDRQILLPRGGIGLQLYTYFGGLQYRKAGTVVLFIVIVVALMDFASAKLRERLV